LWCRTHQRNPGHWLQTPDSRLCEV
jgi:hypothetical protein